jgi:hypothetical protein
MSRRIWSKLLTQGAPASEHERSSLGSRSPTHTGLKTQNYVVDGKKDESFVSDAKGDLILTPLKKRHNSCLHGAHSKSGDTWPVLRELHSEGDVASPQGAPV